MASSQILPLLSGSLFEDENSLEAVSFDDIKQSAEQMNDLTLALCLGDPEAFLSGDDSSFTGSCSLDSTPSSPVSCYSLSIHSSTPTSTSWETKSTASASSNAGSLNDLNSPNTSFTEYNSSASSESSSVDWFRLTEEQNTAPTITAPNTNIAYSSQYFSNSLQVSPSSQQVQNFVMPQEYCNNHAPWNSFTPSNSVCQEQQPLSPNTLNNLSRFFDEIGTGHQQHCYGNQMSSAAATAPSPSVEQSRFKWNVEHQIQQNYYNNYTSTPTPNTSARIPVKPSLREKQKGKPTETYVALIAKAILSSPTGSMTLTSIYDFIIDNYEFYRTTTLLWRNAVRHNLSINDCFIKAGRTEIGRGYYWAIHSSCLQDFKKGDFRRRAGRSKNNRTQKKSQTVIPMSVTQAVQYQECTATLQYHNQQINSSLNYQSYHHAAPVVNIQQPSYKTTYQ